MEVIMPKMGESVSEGTIIKWHKKVGDRVKRDEIIFEISTDKVDTEIPSPADGVLQEIKVNEGGTVEVGTVVAIINENGETSVQTQQAEESLKEELKEINTVKEEIKPVVEEKPSEKEEPSEIQSSGEVIDIAMPKMGESVMEGTIIKWHKKVGDKVKKDETIFEISTDKVDTEVPSPEEGILAEILVAEQETVEVGTIVARISKGDGVPVKKETKEKVPEVKKEEVKVEMKEPESMHDNFAQVKVMEEEDRDPGFLSPLVLNIAKKENVSYNELKRIKGTGLEGRITKKDILAYVESRKSQPQQPSVKKEEPKAEVKKAPAPSYKPSYSDNEIEKIPMDNI